MKRILLFSALLFLFAGCATYVEVDGKRYMELSDSQKEHLVETSRLTLVKHSKKGLITMAERDHALKNEPEFRIQYRGDRFGSAVILWRTPGRLIEFHFEDDLAARIPVCSMAIRPILPAERRIQPDKSIPGR